MKKGRVDPLKWFNLNVSYLILLGVVVLALWLLIRPPMEEEIRNTQEAPSRESEFRGRFPDYCPPMWAVRSARGWESKHERNQSFSQEFLELFDLLKLQDDTQVLKLEARGFCVFQFNTLMFVVFHDYEDQFGDRVDGRQELQSWFQQKGITDDLCQIIWSQCPTSPNYGPQEKDDEERDDEALVFYTDASFHFIDK
ncbi:MAG: hypothetical protein A2Z11_02980 [Candidatus Woykebacteria bacterium RBG_16_43_9]|uniref:Uncharacterized protein n=1 Tax=Candidatus Woykebacteria bacterium RBG_16_43_9 TaxID=1802596 RepID=A0A1G1WCT1_9BACT|nr:MAG: hypothetical protein A2Z11_02980 [Candidatus Woykebacteria bacterium RBG_16_43_9]